MNNMNKLAIEHIDLRVRRSVKLAKCKKVLLRDTQEAYQPAA